MNTYRSVNNHKVTETDNTNYKMNLSYRDSVYTMTYNIEQQSYQLQYSSDYVSGENVVIPYADKLENIGEYMKFQIDGVIEKVRSLKGLTYTPDSFKNAIEELIDSEREPHVVLEGMPMTVKLNSTDEEIDAIFKMQALRVKQAVAMAQMKSNK